jgi:hypothetical protein
MVALLLDFANQETQNGYPRHGWALNSQGFKLLWFPIVPLVAQVQEVRREKGARIQFQPMDSHRHRPLGQKLHLLLTVLRELHRLKQISEAVDPEDRKGAFEAHMKYRDLAPVYLDSYYIYLRRIADTITNALIPVLFDDYRRIQRSDFRAIRKQVIEGSVPVSRYLCDVAVLAAAFSDHSAWFDRLTTSGTKGARDALEHESGSWLEVGVEGSIDSLRMQGYLWKGNQIVTALGDFIAPIFGINDDFCSFCTKVHTAINWGNGYHVGRPNAVYHLFGEDDDVAGFWPSI